MAGRTQPGDTATYTLELTSPNPLTGVVISDSLPATLTYVPNSVTSNNGAAVANGNTITWTGTLTSDVSTILTYQALVNSTSGNQTITNVAEASWQGITTTASATSDTHVTLFMPLSVQRYCPDIFTEGFATAGDWAHGEDEAVRVGVVNGEYHVVSKEPFLFLFRAPTCYHDYYTVEGDVRWEGHTGFVIGLLYGINADFTDYTFVAINTDTKQFLMYRRNNTTGLTLLRSPEYSGLIHGGTEWNHLKLSHTPYSLEVEIEGVQVLNFNDPDVSPGPTWVGLAMAPYSDEPGAEARFDNFKITRAPYSTTSAADALPNPLAGEPFSLPEYIPTFK